jgi:hypothetical protein
MKDVDRRRLCEVIKTADEIAMAKARRAIEEVLGRLVGDAPKKPPIFTVIRGGKEPKEPRE